NDDQVKVRGYRVELGEIESVLSGHPAVKQCAVAVRNDDHGNRRLVAYFVTAAGTVFDSEGLRDYLRERLPEHMIPSACVELDALPLSAHGKLDRNRLPEPPPSTTLSKDSGSAPQTHAEELLADIWAEVLKIEHIHRESSFFQLGGHSLLVMQVLSRV